MRGKTDGDSSYYNSGRYRCIATNELGSTFFEKNIQIRVLGFFTHGNQKYDQPQKEYVTVGQSHIIPCPPHVKGYGTTYSWGTFSGRSSYLLKRYSHGQINNHLFQTRKGELVYAAVSEDDIRESQDIGGLRCILSNGFEEIVSKQVILWIYDSSKLIIKHNQNSLVFFIQFVLFKKCLSKSNGLWYKNVQNAAAITKFFSKCLYDSFMIKSN